MAAVLQPIVNELDTVRVHLRTELKGLQTDADGAGIAIVMGPVHGNGVYTPIDRVDETAFRRDGVIIYY